MARVRNTDALRAELEELRDPLGHLRPQVVVDWAREHPGSELYKEFQWDVEKAAMAHWLNQARSLIAYVLVEERTGYRETFSLVSDRPYGRGYRDVGEVFTHNQMRAEAVRMALKEQVQWRHRYVHLSPELDELFRVIDRMTNTPPPPAGAYSRRPPPPPPRRGGPRGGGGGRGSGRQSPRGGRRPSA